jgi:C4-dicarboxylate-specific signal transduction histidine kinase
MDVRIQGSRDGIETAAVLRASCDAPIVYLTAHADDATILRARATGPSGYLVKPVKMRELYSAIELSLHRHEMERAQRRLAPPGAAISGLAHEIDDPLAVVIASAGRVRDGIEGIERALRRGEAEPIELAARLKELSRAQGAIATAAARITRIVSDLKELSRPAEAPGRADVGRAIRWAVQATAHLFDGRARLVQDVAELPPVPGDEARLGQVLARLLTGAARATEPGSAAASEVAIHARVEGGRVVVEIRDGGAGRTPANLSRLFEPLHGIVRSLGGSLEVGQPGPEAIVRVTLGVAPGAAPSTQAPGPP